MIILSIKTDHKIAEIGLFNSRKKLDYLKWQAHKELSATIHGKIEEILESNNMSWNNLDGIVFYEGPGSFTGLRIGASVANGLAYGLGISAAQANGDNWTDKGIKKLLGGYTNSTVIPQYGEPAHTTKPRK